MKIRINIYNRNGDLINAFEFCPGNTKEKKFDATTQSCFDQALKAVSEGGSFQVNEVLR